jgi:4-methylaminobutanoate oxidase (formaldehyde-forming)
VARRGKLASCVLTGALAGIEALGDDGEGFRFPRRSRRAEGARDLFPLIELDNVVGAAWIAGDGYVDPTSLTNAYAVGARAGGIKLLQGVRVTGMKKRGRRVTTVITDQGEIEAECVIDAAGMWGREIAAMVGTRVPACAVEHQYFVTEKSDRIPTICRRSAILTAVGI